MRKIVNLGLIFLLFFVKKIDCLIALYDLDIKINNQLKEGFNLSHAIVYMNQNYIYHDDICSTLPAKILPPPAWSTPQHF